MADYHPLIARAVDGLGTSTGEARRALYERARAALVAQLRGIEPPLSEADITRERLALEDAIRKVEAETVRKSRAEPRPAAPPLRPNRARRQAANSAAAGMPPRRDRPIPPLGETPPAPRARRCSVGRELEHGSDSRRRAGANPAAAPPDERADRPSARTVERTQPAS